MPFGAFVHATVGEDGLALAVYHVDHVVNLFFGNQVVSVGQVEGLARVFKCKDPVFVNVYEVGHLCLVGKRVKVHVFLLKELWVCLCDDGFVIFLGFKIFVKVVWNVGFGKMFHVIILVCDKVLAGILNLALKVVADFADVLNAVRLVSFHLRDVNCYRAHKKGDDYEKSKCERRSKQETVGCFPESFFFGAHVIRL